MYDLTIYQGGLTNGWYDLIGVTTLADGQGGFSYTEQVDQLLGGWWYITIITEESPSGEVRGQIQPTGRFFRLIKP